MKKASLLATVLLVSACAPMVRQSSFDEFKKIDAESWRQSNVDLMERTKRDKGHQQLTIAILQGMKAVGEYLRRFQQNDERLEMMFVGANAQSERNFKLLLSALKRRGIKIDLDKEAELLQKEKAKRDKAEAKKKH